MHVDVVQNAFELEKHGNKRKVSSETTITRFKPAPIYRKKIGGVCYYIVSVNKTMVVKLGV